MTTARPAAATMLLRGGSEAIELLMVRRTPHASFKASHWVFPGGSVDAADGAGETGFRSAALRELREEAGVELPAGGELVPFARWITPERLPIRFDTWFFLAEAPEDARPEVDGTEIVDFRWITPAQGIESFEAGDLELAFPTRKQLEQLTAFTSAGELMRHAREHADGVRPIQPVVVGEGPDARIILPDDHAAEDAASAAVSQSTPRPR